MRALACLLVLALCVPPPALGQAVRRCVTAGGQSVYTDQPCESLGAAPRGDPAAAATAGATLAPGFAIRGCARTPRQLLEGVRGALEARDANRLANYYHWPGTSRGAARFLMDELERIAARATVDLGYPGHATPDLAEAAPGDSRPGDPGAFTGRLPEAPRTDAPDPAGSPPMPDPFAADPTGTPLPAPRPAAAPDAGARPARAPRAPPTRLRLEQAAGVADATLPVTEFQVLRHADCWWIAL